MLNKKNYKFDHDCQKPRKPGKTLNLIILANNIEKPEIKKILKKKTLNFEQKMLVKPYNFNMLSSKISI